MNHTSHYYYLFVFLYLFNIFEQIYSFWHYFCTRIKELLCILCLAFKSFKIIVNVNFLSFLSPTMRTVSDESFMKQSFQKNTYPPIILIKSRDSKGGFSLCKLYTCLLFPHFAMLCKNKNNEQAGMLCDYLGSFEFQAGRMDAIV